MTSFHYKRFPHALANMVFVCEILWFWMLNFAAWTSHFLSKPEFNKFFNSFSVWWAEILLLLSIFVLFCLHATTDNDENAFAQIIERASMCGACASDDLAKRNLCRNCAVQRPWKIVGKTHRIVQTIGEQCNRTNDTGTAGASMLSLHLSHH